MALDRLSRSEKRALVLRMIAGVLGYDTNVTYGSFVLQQIATAMLFGLVSTITFRIPSAHKKTRKRKALRLNLEIRPLFRKQFPQLKRC